MPVHLKGGVSDAVLYRATMGLTLMGMLLSLWALQGLNTLHVGSGWLFTSPSLKHPFPMSACSCGKAA